MYPYRFADPVPRAGISTHIDDDTVKYPHLVDSVGKCMSGDDSYKGGDRQMAFRNTKLDEPGRRLHTPGVMDPEPKPKGTGFGVNTQAKNYSTADCLNLNPTHSTKPYMAYLDFKEAGYHRSRDKLGQVPTGIAQIPESTLKNGFGVNTKFGESAGSVIQGTKSDIPNDVRLHTGYQTKRNYNWESSRINPVTHTFGVVGESEIDHIPGVYEPSHHHKLISVAVDRAEKNYILQDPDPLDMKTGIYQHTLTASQLKGNRDPAELPPAGLCTQSSEFSIGDTIAEMGCIEAFDVDYQPVDRDIRLEDEMVHGVPTRPNPFPNPLKGQGKYTSLGLSDESFLLLRDKAHVVPVMVKALALTEEEASQIFDRCAEKFGRDKISVSEFHEEFKQMSN